jgi:hypothetical protein
MWLIQYEKVGLVGRKNGFLKMLIYGSACLVIYRNIDFKWIKGTIIITE